VADPKNPTETEIKAAITTARDRFLAMGLILHSDPQQYAGLIQDVENQYMYGNIIYPKTLPKAYDILINYKAKCPSQGLENRGLNFLAQGSDPTSIGGRGCGHGSPTTACGRCGHGRGHAGGCGECKIPLSTMAEESPVEGSLKTNSHLQFLLNELDKIDDYFMFDRVAHCHCNAPTSSLNPYLLLLDSCSTINIISNHHMLTNIHLVHPPLCIQCNVSTKQTNLMATFGDFPEAVWYDPDSVANILSLHTVSKHYTITYDSHHDNTFHITDGHHLTYHFSPTGMGLYAHQCSQTDQTHWASINTI